jgi:hypothetical protein
VRWGLLVVLVLVAAGCGGSAHVAAPPVSTVSLPAPAAKPRPAKPLPPKLRRDLRAIRLAAAPVKHNSLMGTPALQRTTGTFLDDLQRSKLSLIEQNRALDHAASAVAGSCDQCFQMIEAERPIPAIAH